VAFEPFPPGAADVTAQATKVRDASPDFIVSWATGPDNATALRALDRLGVQTQIGLNGGVTTDVFGRIAGPTLLNGKMAATYPPESISELPNDFPLRKSIENYLQGMKEGGFDSKNGASTAYLSWDAVDTLVQGIEAAGDTKAESVRDALERQRFVGASAVYNRTAENHNGAVGTNYYLSKNTGGQWKLAYIPKSARSS